MYLRIKIHKLYLVLAILFRLQNKIWQLFEIKFYDNALISSFPKLNILNDSRMSLLFRSCLESFWFALAMTHEEPTFRLKDDY